MDEAKRGNIPDELKLNRQKVLDLLDNRITSTNPQNEAYKELLIAACNHLNSTLPFLFEKISDYSELLLPDDLTSDFSIVTDFRNGIQKEDCKNVEVVGWLYQFYISEKKDEVFASKSAVKKEDIPAATQLFTPRWIVEYMVQNTVGKLWLQNRPKSRLREHMPYFIESATVNSDDYLKIASPEEIRLLDPASGSGHILVYGFDLLTKIYEEEGYQTSEIPKLIIEKNLHGFEIDERAAQLSGFALMMKAVDYQRRSLRKNIIPNILCFKDLKLDDDEINNAISELQLTVTDELIGDLKTMQQATNFGSLIIPKTKLNDLQAVFDHLENLKLKNNLFQKAIIDELSTAVGQLIKLSPKFFCVVANPPYMGGGNMNKELSEFVKKYYPNSKADLMACFMELGLFKLNPMGFMGMINQHSWMFLSSYEKLRVRLIENIFFDTLLHLGARTFPEIGGEVVQNAAFTFWNTTLDEKGSYIRLVDYDKSELKRSKTLEAIVNTNCKWFHKNNQNEFCKIPGNPISYWVGHIVYDSFNSNESLGKNNKIKSGVMTGNDILFLKYWSEVNIKTIGFNYLNETDIDYGKFKYFPMNKEEGFRKWSGRYRFVLNLENNGLNFKQVNGLNYRLRDSCLYFQKGISWGDVAGERASYRFQENGLIFAARAPMIFTTKKYLVAFLNSIVSTFFQSVLNPTLCFNLVDMERLPIAVIGNKKEIVNSIVDICISISSLEWNSKETSWDFAINNLIRIQGQDLEETYDLYQQFWKNKFFQLHKNEEELNRQFIEIYGLQEELTPDVPLEDITILKEETSIVNGQLVFNANEVFAQFMSYAVGCMFGRYSLDKEGLILANQGESLEDYFQKVYNQKSPLGDLGVSFVPDEDNIIPILDEEWFEDDIVARFHKFLKVTFGESNFSKNLAFVEEQLGKDIRKYFTKDFYSDHIKRYKKRPIYWMFSSPKGSFNVLIYMHRYTPDTVSNILNKYLREFSGKLKTRLETLEHIKVSGTASEKTKAIKESDSIDKMLIDLHEYERDILYPIATERIAIDLDDGVLVNYNKFGKAIKEVAGLNDKATKKKVKEFDWIDATQIR